MLMPNSPCRPASAKPGLIRVIPRYLAHQCQIRCVDKLLRNLSTSIRVRLAGCAAAGIGSFNAPEIEVPGPGESKVLKVQPEAADNNSMDDNIDDEEDIFDVDDYDSDIF